MLQVLNGLGIRMVTTYSEIIDFLFMELMFGGVTTTLAEVLFGAFLIAYLIAKIAPKLAPASL